MRAERAAEAAAYFAQNAAALGRDPLALRRRGRRRGRHPGAPPGPGPFRRLVDLGTGSGRMLTLLGRRADSAIGLDLSQQMLNIARVQRGQAPA